MTLVLTTLNTRHTYRSLALPQLAAACIERPWGDRIRVIDFSLKEPLEAVFARLCDFEPALVGFSCYLWNVERQLRLARMLKAVRPEVRVQRSNPLLRAEPGRTREVSHLASSVNSCIRSAGAGHAGATARDSLDCLLDFPLHSPLIRLKLPAGEICPIIFYDNSEFLRFHKKV